MKDKLNILWTSESRDTFFNMLSMYTINAKKRGWWKEVNVIIWGGSARLTGTDTQVQSEIMEMIAQGIHIEACQDCAERYGVSEILKRSGIIVRYMGEPMTAYLKADEKFIFV
ncbi:MAG: DsrE family protein [Bacteroides sp.]|nr:DsrE family protein [Bacteroides sp.]